MGKIHDTEWAEFELTRYKPNQYVAQGAYGAFRGEPISRELLKIEGYKFRRVGLGKDVTDKVLAGLPGIQKEGCDGLITSCRWVLHRMPKHIRTVCLEFFGNAQDAVPSIVEIKDSSTPSRAAPCSLASSTSMSATCARWAIRPRASVGHAQDGAHWGHRR